MKRHWLLAALLICGVAHAQNATIPGLTARGTPAATDQFIVWPNGATRAQSTYGSDLMTYITSQIFSGSTAAGNLAKWSASGVLAAGNLTGDVTTSNSLATTLATTGVAAGSYLKMNATIDAKGRITAASSGDNVIQNIMSSSVSPGPTVNANATLVYVTSSGSGGDEYVNIINAVGDVANTNHTVIISYATVTDPADHVHVLVNGDPNLYPLSFVDGNFDSPPAAITGYKVTGGAELDTAGQATAFLRTLLGVAWTPYVVAWQDAAPYYSADISVTTLDQLAGSALAGGNITVHPGAGDGAAAGGNIVLAGGDGGATGDGGNVTLTPGTGHGGGTDGKVILSNVTGAAQCLEADTGGAVAGTGAPCGGGGGSGTVTNVATGSGLTGGPITTTGTVSVTANVRTRSFGTSFGDTAGSVLASGSVVYFTVPYACTISAWNATVNAGTVTFDVWKIATGTAIPTVANTITAAALPEIAAGTALHSTAVGTWTNTSVVANDIIGIQLKTVATARYAELDIECDQ